MENITLTILFRKLSGLRLSNINAIYLYIKILKF